MKLLADHSQNKGDPQSFFAHLWFMSKYETEKNLYQFLMRTRSRWQANSFLRRQATATMSRFGERTVGQISLINHQAMSGIPTAVSVATQLSQFFSLKSISFNLSAYLFPHKPGLTYPHAKFIVLCSALASMTIRSSKDVHKQIDVHVKDEWHRDVLRNEFHIPLP